MTIKTTDWDKFATSSPNNADAARAVAPGTHYEPEIPYTQPHFSNPPDMLPTNVLDADNLNFHAKFVGKTRDRLTVMGYAKAQETINPADPRWVVRCVCSHYEYRRSSVLLSQDADGFMCQNCAHTESLKDRARSTPQPLSAPIEPAPSSPAPPRAKDSKQGSTVMSINQATMTVIQELEAKRDELTKQRDEISATIRQIRKVLAPVVAHEGQKAVKKTRTTRKVVGNRVAHIIQILVESETALTAPQIREEMNKRGLNEEAHTTKHIGASIYHAIKDARTGVIKVDRGYFWVKEKLRKSKSDLVVAGEKDSDGIFRTGPAI